MAWKRSVGAYTILESQLGVIVVDEERAPIVPLAQWTHGLDVKTVEQFTTLEGEYAAIAVAEDRLRAIVLGDRHYAQLDGHPAALQQAAFAGAFRDVVKRVTLQLGVRRRRYHYVPPAGWLPVMRGLTTDWIAPTQPRGVTQIRVNPAVPNPADVESVLTSLVEEAVGSGFTIELGARNELTAGFAIEMIMASDHGAKLWRTWALLRSGPYLCTQRLDCADEVSHAKERTVFDALVASVEPVPQALMPIAEASFLLWSV